MYRPNKKILTIILLCIAMLGAQTFAQKEHHEEPPKNLQVLSKTISGEELHKVMREYAISLGVHCNFCHASAEGSVTGKPRLDFASDLKPEKNIARGMIKMVDSINGMLDNIGNHNLQHITCVSCHHGNTTPIVSTDSLVKKDHQ